MHIKQSTTDDSEMTVGIENQSGTAGVQSFRGTGSLSNVAFRYSFVTGPLLVTACLTNIADVTISATGGVAPYTGNVLYV